MEKETFKDIEGYENRYQINQNGDIKTIECGKFKLLKPSIGKNGYRKVILSQRGFRYTFLVHRLLAKAFIPNPENKPCINHINGIRSDNRIENLEWCTMSENSIHSYKVLGRTCGERKKGGENPRSKNITQYTKQMEFVKTFGGCREAGRETNINHKSISHCALGKRPSAGGYIWKYEC